MSGLDSISQHLRRLQTQGLTRLEAQMLVLHAAGQHPSNRAWLISHDEQVLTSEQAYRLHQHSQRRLDGEPMAYVLGMKEFHGLPLQVDARVLDPRDDTETLVDWALELLAPEQPNEVLDLGTGSGAIALALAHARPAWRVSALDISVQALTVARQNGERLGLNVRWLQGSWLTPCSGQCFDLIVSNPPYIAAHDPHLTALRHEPMGALVSGVDGLEDLRQIIATAPAHLRPGAWLMLEHGHDQATAVREMLRQAGMRSISSRQDLAGIERCSAGQWSPKQGFASREII